MNANPPRMRAAALTLLATLSPAAAVAGCDATEPVVVVRATRAAVVSLRAADSADAARASIGSGVVVDRRGYVLTSAHVVGARGELVAVRDDGRLLPARVLARDDSADLALLRVDGDAVPQALELADGDGPEVGARVLALGNPFGLGLTATSGIISARPRSVAGERLAPLLQTDAAINPGNSGGALVDMQCRLVGINTAAVGIGQGIGFATPAPVIRAFLDAKLPRE